MRNPRLWLQVAGAWLVLAGLAHTVAHVWTFVLENGMVGLREFAMNAMKQARSTDPLEPSLWRLFRSLSVSFSLFLLFAGSANIVIARFGANLATLRAFALFGTVFWTIAFVPYAFVDPVIQPIMVALLAVPLHAVAYAAASLAIQEGLE
jgi:hypothetical protein